MRKRWFGSRFGSWFGLVFRVEPVLPEYTRLNYEYGMEVCAGGEVGRGTVRINEVITLTDKSNYSAFVLSGRFPA